METGTDSVLPPTAGEVPNHYLSIDIYAASDILAHILKPTTLQISSELGLAITDKAR
jgi:hypothetical protein